jgi:(+)-trans-carveol dehydrogenase
MALCGAGRERRDAAEAAVDDGVAQPGRLDIALASAGVAMMGGRAGKTKPGTRSATIDINLTGVWNTTRAAIPHLIAVGRGGAIASTSSVGAEQAKPYMSHYISAKHGVIGPMRSPAVELGQWPVQHPGQLRPADQRQDPDVHERRRVPHVPPRLGETGPDDIKALASMMHVPRLLAAA